MERCSWCGSSDLHKRPVAERRFTLARLRNIVLHDVTVVTCSRCRRSEPEVIDVDGLRRALARVVIGKRERLMPQEIRFLRKQLGLSAVSLATHLGTTPESVSRWENGRTPMGVTSERLLRLMVIVEQGAPCPLNALRTVARENPKSTPIHVRRYEGAWEASVRRRHR